MDYLTLAIKATRQCGIKNGFLLKVEAQKIGMTPLGFKKDNLQGKNEFGQD